MSRFHVLKARGSTKILKVLLTVTNAWTANATDYWTITLRLVKPGQSIGERVGDAYSLAARSLSANTDVTLYDNPVGLAMSDGDRLSYTIEGTGSPATLGRVEVFVRLQS